MNFLFFLVSIFCFIGILYPTKWHKFFELSKRWQWALVWLLSLLVWGVFGALDDESKNIASTAQPTTKPSIKTEPVLKPKPAPQPAKPAIAKIGQWVKAGELEYKINKVEETKKIKGTFESHQPDADTFAVLYVSVRNNDKKTRFMDSSMTILKDKQGREFEYDIEPTTTFNIEHKNKTDIFTELPPTGEREFVIVYDIRGSAKDYTFHGKDGYAFASEGNEAVISLGE